ncbi:hypothetical protein CWR41_01335 [Cedecea lapagei]|jgi:hypothetical protein|nr:hypothetical protein CWR41_01335 [Cedecea lapagei]
MQNRFIKCKYFFLFILLALFIPCRSTLASFKNCSADSYVDFTGTINAYVSQDNNDLITEDMYIFSVKLAKKYLECTLVPGSPTTGIYYSLNFNNGMFPSTTTATGKYALEPVGNNPANLSFMIGYDDDGGARHYATSSRLNVPMEENASGDYVPKETLIFSLATKQGGESAVAGVYTFSGKLADVDAIDSQDRSAFASTSQVAFNVTVNLRVTACLVTTDKNYDLRWPSLTPSEIINNQADELNADVSITCNGGPTPVKISAASSNGAYDAAGGIIKTNSENLGIKLKWQDNQQPVSLASPRTDTLSGTKNYNIVAQPVRYGSGNISGGEFSSTVTLSIEYR